MTKYINTTLLWSDAKARGVVRAACSKRSLENVAPQTFRRTCASLCHDAGGELGQIQFPLGHVSMQTTERYIGCKQRLRNAVNDAIGIEPDQCTTPDRH